MPNHPTYRRHVLEHLGLVAGMVDARGLGEVIDQATRQHPAMRDLTVGEAVNARGLKGLGCSTHARDRGPRCFQQQPPYRLMAPRVPPAQRTDEALGRTLDTLDGDGVTARYRRLAVRAATRLGRCPTATPLDTTSVHGDGRDNSAEEPEAQVVHSTQGESGAPRPDLNHGRLALRVEPQAGSPRRLTPRRGHRRAPHPGGPVRRAHGEHGPTTSGATDVVADRARDREDHLDKLAHTAITWRRRVPAPWSEAPAALVQAEPQARAARHAGDRAHAWTAPSGGVEPRGVRLEAELRQAPAQRTVDTPLRQQRDTAVHTCTQGCRPTVACEAAARQARSAVEPGLPATFLTTSTVRAPPREGQRGRPGRDAHPDPVVSQLAGAVAAAIPARPARVDPHRGGILATTARDDTPLPPPAGWHGDTGQVPSARGGRLVNDPPCCASARARNKPARLMARLRVMTVCLLGEAAWEDRSRQALNHHAATVPDHQGTRRQQPTARWVLPYVVGLHGLCQAGHWPMVLNRTEAHQPWRRLLGPPDRRLYDGRYS